MSEHEHLERLERAREIMKNAHREAMALMIETHQGLSSVRDQGDRVDAVFLLRRISAMADDVRKEAEKMDASLTRAACIQYLRELFSPGGSSDRIIGRIAGGRPSVETAMNLPSREREPEKYAALLEALGVSEHARSRDIARIHWPSLSALISEREAAGLPPLPGADPNDHYPVYKLSNVRELSQTQAREERSRE